jgi:PST family polysaccharide transporter
MGNDTGSLVNTTARSTMWAYAATYGGRALGLITVLVLARIMGDQKDAFGLVSAALTVIAFLEVLQDLGIGSALIYNRDEDAADTSFWLGLGIAATLFGITWLIAPVISNFSKDLRLTPIIRALGISFPLFALRNIHDALLRKNLQFKRRFVPDLLQMVAKLAISVTLGLMDFGAWSLVWGQLGGSAVGVLAYWAVNPWRPHWRFNSSLTRSLLTYGTSLVAVNALAVLLARADYLFVNRYLGTEVNGMYTLAFQLPDLIVMQFCVVIANVMFPVYTRLRDDPDGMQKGFLITTRYVAVATVPLALGMAVTAGPLVQILLGNKWADAVPVMRAIAIYTLFLSLGFNAGDVYKAQGRPGILTRLSLIRAVILIPALWWATARLGSIVAVGWTHAVVAFIGSALNLAVASRMLHVSLGDLLKAFAPALISGATMTVAVLAVLLPLQAAPAILQLIVAVVVGASAYCGTLWWTQRDLVQQASQTLRGALARR